jgi:hypothetical protein
MKFQLFLLSLRILKFLNQASKFPNFSRQQSTELFPMVFDIHPGSLFLFIELTDSGY